MRAPAGLFDANALALAQAFWPGPMTLVVPASSGCTVSELARAGLPPSPCVFQPIRSRMRCWRRPAGRSRRPPPIARAGSAPRPPPTRWADLEGRIDAVLDAGPTEVGVESTIVACLDGAPRLLRPGGVPREAIEGVIGRPLVLAGEAGHAPLSPGLLASHYAPAARMRLDAEAPLDGEAWLGFGPGRIIRLRSTGGPSGDLREAAANLFGHMREAGRARARRRSRSPTFPSRGWAKRSTIGCGARRRRARDADAARPSISRLHSCKILACLRAGGSLSMHAKLAWDDFRLVKAIADHDGLTGAAAALGVNHSTVFRRLGQIEELVGMPLFERRKTGYVATVAGAEMAALASRMDEDVTAFSRRLAGRDVAPSGEIRITTTDTLHLNVLLPIFAAFREMHPLIRARRRDRQPGAQPVEARRRHRDPGKRLAGRDAGRPAHRHPRLGDLWTCRRRARRRGTGRSGAASTQHDWIALGDQLAHVKAARFVREHVAPERIALKSSAVLGLAEAVEQGLGIGPALLHRRSAAGTGAAPAAQPRFRDGLWVLTHPDIRHVPRVRAFMDFCSAELWPSRQRALFEGRSERKALMLGLDPSIS